MNIRPTDNWKNIMSYLLLGPFYLVVTLIIIILHILSYIIGVVLFIPSLGHSWKLVNFIESLGVKLINE